jgi:hypothetical protein
MMHALKTALGLLAGLAAAGAATMAGAATPSLVGTWSHQVVFNGRAMAVVWDEFGANGQLHTRFVTPKGTIDLVGSYQVLNGGSVVRAVYTDWSPKQTCTSVCTPNPSPMPIGRQGDSAVRFDGPNVVYFGVDRYTRHP